MGLFARPPQRMKLVLEGFGKSTPNISKIDFVIAQVSSHPGYSSNKSDPSIEANGNTDDYSFRMDGREGAFSYPSTLTILPTSTATDMYGGNYGGEMEDHKTWVNFYCKDYGGASLLFAKVHFLDGSVTTLSLSVPLDDDFDGIADKWEQAMHDRWRAQYHVNQSFDLTTFSPGDDLERKDPDGFIGMLVDQAETGDGHTVMEEYRGYILDGGGLDGAGANGHAGGHIRLDPARKEILVEVDRAAVIDNIPAVGLSGVLNGGSGVFSNASRGTGIYMYWLMDEVSLDLPVGKLDTQREIFDALSASRDTVANRASATLNRLSTDFMHFIFADSIAGRNSGAQTVGGGDDPTIRGTIAAISDLNDPLPIWALDPLMMTEHFMTTVAHEITHNLIVKTDGVFNMDEHTDDADEDGNTFNDADDEKCLMYHIPRPANAELNTVRFFPAVQRLMKIRSNEG